MSLFVTRQYIYELKHYIIPLWSENLLHEKRFCLLFVLTGITTRIRIAVRVHFALRFKFLNLWPSMILIVSVCYDFYCLCCCCQHPLADRHYIWPEIPTLRLPSSGLHSKTRFPIGCRFFNTDRYLQWTLRQHNFLTCSVFILRINLVDNFYARIDKIWHKHNLFDISVLFQWVSCDKSISDVLTFVSWLNYDLKF